MVEGGGYFMPDEAAHRPARQADTRHGAGGRGDEHSPLQARAAFIQNWGWDSIVSFNRGACERGRAQHGHNRETHEAVRQRWEEARWEKLSLAETLAFLLRCHRDAPFLFFNGNTFAEIARRIVDVLFADLPLARRREAASLAAHYVAGVLDRDSMTQMLEELCAAACFQAGDRVKTLRGSTHGVVREVLADGRVVWQPDGSTAELIALPGTIVADKPG